MLQRLFSDRFVNLMGKSHPLANGTLTLENDSSVSHPMFAPFGMQRGYIDDQLLQKGYKRFTRLSVQKFPQITYALLGNNNMITLPQRVAQRIADSAPVAIKMSVNHDSISYAHRHPILQLGIVCNGN